MNECGRGDKKAIWTYWVLASWVALLHLLDGPLHPPWPLAWWHIGALWRQDWDGLSDTHDLHQPLPHHDHSKAVHESHVLALQTYCLPSRNPSFLFRLESYLCGSFPGLWSYMPPPQVHLRQPSFPWGQDHVFVIFYTLWHCRAAASMTMVGLNMDLL